MSEELKKLLGLGRLDRNEIKEEMEQAEMEGTAPEMMRDPFGSQIQDLQDIRKEDTTSAVEDAIEKERANRQAKSPNLKTKDELEKDDKELDLPAKYRKIMEDYEKAQKEEVKGPSFSEALPDVLTQLYNLSVRTNPTGLKQMKLPGTAAAAVKSRQAAKDRKLAGIDKTRSQLLDLMKLQASADKAKKKTTYKFDDKIVEIQPDGTLKTLAEASSPKLGFAEKERIKAEAKAVEAVDKAYAKDYNDYILQGGYASLDKNIKILEDAQKKLKDPDGPNLTGAGLGLVPDFIRRFTAPESIAVRDRVESVIQQSLRQILGAQFTEKEAERLIQRSYNEGLDEKENAKRLKETIGELRTMADAKEEAAKYFEEKGTLEGFKPTSSKASAKKINKPKIKVELPNGQRGTIDANKLEAFKAKYPKAKILE